MSLENDDIQAVLIAGPTASGKSALALAIARATGGAVVNADSMQVYDGLEILTARPSAADLAAAPHRLYGHVSPDAAYSVGEWARDAAEVLHDLKAEGRLPIVCGGTGLYFRALLGGIDAMPPIPPAVREHWRLRMASEGSARLHEELARLDPDAAARLNPADTQRILRAHEILAATGRPFAALQRGAGEPLIAPGRTLKIVLRPPRDRLRAAIGHRFEAMLGLGALEEAVAFAAVPGALAGTAGKAIGVAELIAHADGSLTLAEAARRAVTRTRQYAKRQDTWFRHQLDASWTEATEFLNGSYKDLIDRVNPR